MGYTAQLVFLYDCTFVCVCLLVRLCFNFDRLNGWLKSHFRIVYHPTLQSFYTKKKVDKYLYRHYYMCKVDNSKSSMNSDRTTLAQCTQISLFKGVEYLLPIYIYIYLHNQTDVWLDNNTDRLKHGRQTDCQKHTFALITKEGLGLGLVLCMPIFSKDCIQHSTQTKIVHMQHLTIKRFALFHLHIWFTLIISNVINMNVYVYSILQGQYETLAIFLYI